MFQLSTPAAPAPASPLTYVVLHDGAFRAEPVRHEDGAVRVFDSIGDALRYLAGIADACGIGINAYTIEVAGAPGAEALRVESYG